MRIIERVKKKKGKQNRRVKVSVDVNYHWRVNAEYAWHKNHRAVPVSLCRSNNGFSGTRSRVDRR
jgi:hypothetical protein